ncbi:MAG: site-specific DNA-methyltransferase [SAR86 cluster bacterium]|uniref:Methyltransferase n=1 Tax=SAR86 cluster bacterium TaxID=2030880 RepID=A0A2A5AN68_9GAMM|nr:MAG: site-specific DNA-methyltransferase [SAR86 cluster bacterium]
MKFRSVPEGKKIPLNESTLLQGDALHALQILPSNSVQCIVTSPPYWGMRDYNVANQIGLESTLPQFINRLLAVFDECRRVLKDNGVFWLNIGDGYTSGNRGWRAPDSKHPARAMSTRPDTPEGLKPKDLLGLPWRLAFALQDDGWYLRVDVIWNKPNAMPESVKDRPPRSHEYLFMLTKNERYFYDRESMLDQNGKNRRSVWDINTKPSTGSHFATFPPKLITPCILSSTNTDDFVLDPFFGTGTTGVVAVENGRKFVGIELNPEYVKFSAERLMIASPLVLDRVAN